MLLFSSVSRRNVATLNENCFISPSFLLIFSFSFKIHTCSRVGAILLPSMHSLCTLVLYSTRHRISAPRVFTSAQFSQHRETTRKEEEEAREWTAAPRYPHTHTYTTTFRHAYNLTVFFFNNIVTKGRKKKFLTGGT